MSPWAFGQPACGCCRRAPPGPDDHRWRINRLLDTHYGEKGVASGVGIRIYDERGAPLNLLPDKTSTGTGNARGWYGYKSSRYKPAKKIMVRWKSGTVILRPP